MSKTFEEQFKEDAESLRQFKSIEGYKVLVKLVRGYEANLLRKFMSSAELDEKQLRADCRAWHTVVEMIDETIDSYDNWLEGVLTEQKHQQQQLKGYKNVQR